jgi:two-component system phosphate regulon response regulator PhoB
MRPLIFLVENDQQSCRVIRAYLERASYRVREYFSREILSQIEELRPSLVLIDVSLQAREGLDLCSRIRGHAAIQDVRVILLADRASANAYLMGFNAGADDCLTLPVLPGELMATVEAVLRCTRSAEMAPRESADTVLKLGSMELNLLALRVSVAGETVPTTILEFRLLEYMVRNRGRVFTRDQLLDAVWGQERFVTPRSVDACVRRIRNKIEAGPGGLSFLKTVRGVGYYLENAQRPLTAAANVE